jgi:hypothetical protein
VEVDVASVAEVAGEAGEPGSAHVREDVVSWRFSPELGARSGEVANGIGLRSVDR